MQTRKKSWRDLTPIARPLWKAAYDLPWPSGWHVYSVPWMRGAEGLCIYGRKQILINRSDFRYRCEMVTRDGQPNAPLVPKISGDGNILRTLVHEFTHMRWGHSLRHGRDFDRLVDAAYAHVWEH